MTRKQLDISEEAARRLRMLAASEMTTQADIVERAIMQFGMSTGTSKSEINPPSCSTVLSEPIEAASDEKVGLGDTASAKRIKQQIDEQIEEFRKECVILDQHPDIFRDRIDEFFVDYGYPDKKRIEKLVKEYETRMLS